MKGMDRIAKPDTGETTHEHHCWNAQELSPRTRGNPKPTCRNVQTCGLFPRTREELQEISSHHRGNRSIPAHAGGAPVCL